ncbi:DUF938 domain-containing protein [Shimia litoralis]|uniref:DUF938 domain-containing protein n=1 Tax=Shimia litoralis TaxID=420403 RepID=A0A4U7N8R5_9RHOB|nr:DUF938 domain-containing protein [Shimia litoralis]TKZ22188.1 DUF938 domain-containing protein [Shimia litoralis]
MPRRLVQPTPPALSENDARLVAPSATRNVDHIVAVAQDFAPDHEGTALELASGTGQHIIHLAQAIPHLQWQPSEIDPDRRSSINAYVQTSPLPNISPAVPLDATTSGWATRHLGQSFILLVNLLHLISEAEARILISEAAAALAPGGVLMVYGPFMRAGDLTSQGDIDFHTSLRNQDPEIGYKDDFDVLEWGQDAWLDYVDLIEMPANNLALIWRKPT